MYNNNEWENNEVLDEPLKEPVAFEEFQFSLGLDPGFAMPFQLDIPPTSIEYIPPLLPYSTQNNTSVLNEQDQKAFSQFLDQFYLDPNMQIDPHTFSLYEQIYPPNKLPKKKPFKNDTIYIQHQIKDDTTTFHHIKQTDTNPTHEETTNKIGGGGAVRRGKSNKELLTEEEKRNNHIASEQKRRGMIRSGFKDLTEIVPALKNLNNSKSTILFKAVDYIKHLENRNRSLREKIKRLEMRVEKGRMLGTSPRRHQSSSTQHKTQRLFELQQTHFKPSNNSNNSFWHNENIKNEYEDIISA
ncbi:hypothetical protein G6F61_002867 [Rhizopus arrhizus]|nr:hypothetical protein G6F61_002867 [Rhizopus arrhizus]